jgi:nicotinate-nucleotide adenylyltransferase
MGDAEIFLVIGEDAARSFNTWHRYEELARISNLVVVNRSAPSVDKVVPAGATRCEHVTIPSMDISSSDIRRRVREGQSIDFLVRRPVRNVIETQHLYMDHQ